MIFKKKYTDQQLLGDIYSVAAEANNRAFAFLYRQYLEPFRHFVCNHGGGAEEAKDLFQEGIIVFYKKTKAGEEIGYPTTFFFSVCKNLWLDRARQKANHDRIARELPPELTSDDLEAALEAERNAALMGLLGTLGDGCREVLLGFYYERKSMQELAGTMGYASEAVAKNKKANCLKKLRDLVLGNRNHLDVLTK
ncbi:MAG TPA: sigma-70 family RNA polymerase sigma factor [Cytophagales bacterium]|jgi:RNA polymerase sigma factor (sigma-70 family)